MKKILWPLLLLAGLAAWLWHDPALGAGLPDQLARIRTALGQLGWTALAVVCALSCVNYALRILRWILYLRVLGVRLPWRQHALLYLAGFALTFTPAKGGEAIRSLWYQRLGVNVSLTLAAFVSERLMDLVAMLVLAVGILWVYPQYGSLLLGMLAVLGTGTLLLMNERLLSRLQQHTRHPGLIQGLGRLRGFAVQLRACNRPRLLLPVLLLSVAGWGLEALSLYWLIGQMGFGQVSPGYVTFSYATGLLAGVASILPGGLGGTELVMGSLLHLGGLTVAAASACTLILRVGTLGWACVLGWLCWPWAIRQVSGPKN